MAGLVPLAVGYTMGKFAISVDGDFGGELPRCFGWIVHTVDGSEIRQAPPEMYKPCK